METILYKNGKIKHTVINDDNVEFNNAKNCYTLSMDGKSFEFHANMWMEI